jgi:hypothetical protein
MTVESLYNMAKFPERVFLGICEQNKKNEQEESCLKMKDFKYKDNIRFSNMNYLEAKGPSYARYFCSQLWDYEQYFLQIDSHTIFEKDWDVQLIEMLEQCRKESTRPVLSVYPPSTSENGTESGTENGFPEMDYATVSEDGILMFQAGIRIKKYTRPIRSTKPFYAAGFMFTDGNFLYDVPYDPSLTHLFQGEEVLFSARMFTHGYDVYSPNISVLSHHYERKGSLYWDDIPDHSECRVLAEKKVLDILNERLKDYEYGLGNVRSMDDFWNASGVIRDDTGKIIKVKRWSSDEDILDSDGWCFFKDGFKKIKNYF